MILLVGRSMKASLYFLLDEIISSPFRCWSRSYSQEGGGTDTPVDRLDECLANKLHYLVMLTTMHHTLDMKSILAINYRFLNGWENKCFDWNNWTRIQTFYTEKNICIKSNKENCPEKRITIISIKNRSWFISVPDARSRARVTLQSKACIMQLFLDLFHPEGGLLNLFTGCYSKYWH